MVLWWQRRKKRLGTTQLCFYLRRHQKWKKAKKDYDADENSSLSFSKGDQIKIFKEKMGWGIGRVNEKYGYFPLKYVCDWN